MTTFNKLSESIKNNRKIILLPQYILYQSNICNKSNICNIFFEQTKKDFEHIIYNIKH